MFSGFKSLWMYPSSCKSLSLSISCRPILSELPKLRDPPCVSLDGYLGLIQDLLQVRSQQ